MPRPSVVGSSGGAGTTITIPTHQAGDLLIIFSYRDGSATAPSLPAGWTTPTGGTGGANTNSSRVGYKVAASSGETSGTWTNATHLIVYVIRGFDFGGNTLGINAIGSVLRSSGASTTVTYGTLNPMKDGDGDSLVIGFAGHRSVDTNLQNAPTGLVNRVTFVDATSEIAAHDDFEFSWPSTNVSVAGTSSGWETIVLEVRAPKVSIMNRVQIEASEVNAGVISVNVGS